MQKLLVTLLALGLFACENETPRSEPSPGPRDSKGKLEIVRAPDGELTEIVRTESERARSEGRVLLVYVGAKWCEPCERFHRAADRGELDAAFPRLRLLELDYDRDGERLRVAGCLSRMIPLFAKPDPAGRCSSQRIEGSIKGEAAVAEITPRLEGLLR